MSGSNDRDELLALLALTIGTIMEDEVDAAVSRFPKSFPARLKLFESLAAAGCDIAALAVAGQALLRRSS